MGGDPGATLITGTASYRERIALPPGAVFEAVLKDVSHRVGVPEFFQKASVLPDVEVLN